MSDVKPISIYCSYAHEDERLVQQLMMHLSSLKREGLISNWHKHNINTGADWTKEVDAHLKSATIILMFISPDFIVSDYCYSVEMQRALERHNAREARVIPIILRPIDWQVTPLGQFQALPLDGKPITLWRDRHDAFLEIADEIRRVITSSSDPTIPFGYKTPQEVISSLPNKVRTALVRGDITVLKRELYKYYNKHSNERLVIHGSETISYENFVLITYAWQCWHMLTSFASGRTLPNLTSYKKKSFWEKIMSTTFFPQKSYPSLDLIKEIVQLLAASLTVISNAELSFTDSKPFFWTTLNVEGLFNNIHVPQQLPLILYTGPHFDESHARELRLRMQQITPKSRLALLFFFLDEKYTETALNILRKNLQGVYAYDIIPLTSKDFLKIIDSSDPKRVFRRHLISKCDLNIVSPFITTGPTSDSMFFGREHEIRAISEQASTVSYALIGGRRIGKTSILRRLARFGLPEAGFRAFYQDCSYTSTQAELVQAITLEWFPTPPSSSFASFASAIHALPDDKPLVILFDEADKLIASDRPAGHPLFNTFRALANAGRCQFVFCGEHSLRTDMANPQSPLYNFANELLIGRLDFRAVQELILQPMKDLEIDLINEKRMVERIWSFTAGHPNVVQRLCQRLINRIKQTQRFYLGIADVEAVITDRDFLRKDFLDTYWERATILERLCSLVMAKNNAIYTLSTIYDAISQLQIHPTLNQVHSALESLVDLRNILQRTSDGYIFAVKAFPEVIAKTSKIDDLLALVCEEYKHKAPSQIQPSQEVL